VHSGIVPRPSMTLAILRRENREKLACVHSTVLPPPTQSIFVFIASIGHSLLLVFVLLSLLIAHVCTRGTANEISTCLLRAALLPSPLDIPGILENILRQLPNAQIRYGPTCVCKAWHLISLRVLGDTATWDHDVEPSNDTTDTIARPPDQTQFDQQLLTATRLNTSRQNPLTHPISLKP